MKTIKKNPIEGYDHIMPEDTKAEKQISAKKEKNNNINKENFKRISTFINPEFHKTIKKIAADKETFDYLIINDALTKWLKDNA